MKKIFNSKMFLFVITAIVFTGVGAFATIAITADQIEYSSGVTVKDKIDDLYTKVKPEYTGSTNVTPTTSNQTLNTNNKILKNDIIINPIPNTYKNLVTTTTATASDISSGKTAYDNNGNLITGNNTSTSCSNTTLSFELNAKSDGYASSVNFDVKNYKSFTITNAFANTNGNRTLSVKYNNQTYTITYSNSLTLQVVNNAGTVYVSCNGTSGNYSAVGRIEKKCA